MASIMRAPKVKRGDDQYLRAAQKLVFLGSSAEVPAPQPNHKLTEACEGGILGKAKNRHFEPLFRNYCESSSIVLDFHATPAAVDH